MTDDRGQAGQPDPHADYLRQAAEHFHQPGMRAPQPPPAIFRPPPQQDQRQPPLTERTEAVTVPQPASPRIAVPHQTPPAPPPFQAPSIPTAPPPYVAPPASAVPSEPPPYVAPPAPGGMPAQPRFAAPSPGAGRDIRPEHVLWALTGFSALATLVSGVAWILIVGVCAYFAWVARTRPILWPPDIEELLVHYRVARPTGRSRGAPYTAGVSGQPLSYIPFRPLTFGEIFSAAYKIVRRNWTTLIGIPLVIFGTFMIALALIVMIVVQIMTSMMESATSLESLGTAMMVGMAIYWLLALSVAFPTDALLIALCVTATDQAVRGARVRLTGVLTAARSRMFAVCRLNAAYYAWFIITEAITYGVFFAALMGAGPGALTLLIPINLVIFALGIMFSLAPTVLVVEGRGVVDSFRRAWDLAKLSWQRLVGIHLLWAVCAVPVIAIGILIVMVTLGYLGLMVLFAVVPAVMVAYFRTLQMLIYTDLRIRQERYDVELSAAWAHNTGAAS